MNIDRSIQFRANDGFSHIQTESPNYILKKKKAIQTTWSDNDDSSSDDEDTVGRLVVHDKKLKLEDSDDEISKSRDICPSRELHILPHDNVRTSSVKSTDEESNSEAESSHDVNSILEL